MTAHRIAGLLSLAALLGAHGCTGPAPTTPILGYEMDDFACDDGRDNDHDGLYDCEDPDCILLSTHCGEHIPLVPPDEPEGSFATCHDQIDNDGNGQFDCGDKSCNSHHENCCILEFDDVSCSDGIDNDGNGFVDCDDFGCWKGIFVTVCDEDSEISCADGVDNDADGHVDCDDPGCGFIFGCQTGCQGDTKGAENTDVTCSDGCDNDTNGFSDCDDYACENLAVCQPPEMIPGPETGLTACSDEGDNDGDGYVDCDDFDCTQAGDAEVDAYCASLAEEDLAACTDGIDNDGNGFVDCDDWSCSQHGSPEAVAHCEASAEATVEACTDGVDNDGNGFVDCADFGCSQSPEAAVAALCVGTAEIGPEACSDGKDNDGNGFVDCDDFSCSKDEGNAEVCPLAALCADFSAILISLCHGSSSDQEKETLRAESEDECQQKFTSSICNEHIVNCTATASTCEEVKTCRDVCFEDTAIKCADGIDNDGNGYTDCEDFECSDSEDFAVRQICQESVFRPYPSDDPADPAVASCKGSGDPTCDDLRVGQANAACSDGLDNDGDGFADCDDWDCSWNPLITVCEGPRVCE